MTIDQKLALVNWRMLCTTLHMEIPEDDEGLINLLLSQGGSTEIIHRLVNQ